MATLDKDKVVGLLNQILEQELAGVVRYTHYSLPAFGYLSWKKQKPDYALSSAALWRYIS